MKSLKPRLRLTAFLLIFICADCTSKSGNVPSTQQSDRQPAVAGQFYPADKNALADSLKVMFNRAKPKQVNKPVLAIICPHAGYVFSGDVAASSYNQVDIKHYKNIIIIGSSHHALYDGASIYDQGDFITPFGKVKINKELAQKLIKENSCFTDDIAPHAKEHCIEVQLPFLQTIFKDDINLLPVLIGTESAKTCENIAKALKPYFNSENLFVISTDFSHYPGYYDAQTSDRLTAAAIESNSPETLLKTLQQVESSGIPNLQTALCGWTSVLTFLNITKDQPNLSFIPIDSKNSGDTKFGGKESVVGYYSIAICQENKTLQSSQDYINNDEKKQLLLIARETIRDYLKNSSIQKLDEKNLLKGTLRPSGAFVTLKKHGELRGCIGNFSAEKPLYQTVQEMAMEAAFHDYRFNPLTKDELDKIELEISVLTPMRKIKSVDEIVLGKHGIYIKKGMYGGTFLPQVATETGWTKEQFLGHCAQDKAGLNWDDWKTADIYVYEAIVFGENDFK